MDVPCSSGWLPPLVEPEGARLMSHILDGTTDSLIHLARVERETERQLRAALLRIGGYLDWDQRAVIRFSETITGRPWSRCGAAEVVQVGRALLDVAVAVRAGNQADTALTPGQTAKQRSTVRAANGTCASCSPVEIRRGDGGDQLRRLFSTAEQQGD
jgi:hypothetical protein